MSREVQTIMHPLKMRSLTVKSVSQVTPKMKRVVLTGPELEDFTSLPPDDHVKVFFPYPGEQVPVVPTLGPDGPVPPADGRKPLMRDYTPRSFNRSKRELVVDFYLHETGVGADWARAAREGSLLTVAGPRGSRVVPYEFDWYLFVGDSASIPSLARRLEEMPAGARVFAVLEVSGRAEEVAFQTSAKLHVTWVHRADLSANAGTATMNQTLERVRQVELPSGAGFTWISMEKARGKEIETYLRGSRGLNPEWIKTTAYWIADR